MALAEGRYMSWITKKPSLDHSRKSSVFSFQGCQWHFEFSYDGRGYCELYLLHMRNNKGQKLPEHFKLTSYIEEDGEPFYYRKETVQGEDIRLFDITKISKVQNFNGRRLIKFVFIFHGDVGMTLHLGDEEVAQRAPCCRIHSCLESLSQDMGELLKEGSNHDVELKCGNRTVKGHRNVLSTRSEVFRAMLHSEMVEGRTGLVEIPDMEADVLQGFLQYLYTGKLPEISSDNARGFYEAGDKYTVKALVRFCADFLIKNLTAENACEMLTLADAHSDQHLKEGVIAYILDNKILLRDDHWLPFCKNNLMLANEVLNRAYKSQIKK